MSPHVRPAGRRPPDSPGGGARVALCAPNAFKGTLSAAAAARALAAGVADCGWHARQVPVADGGDGTLDVLLSTAGASARVEDVRVCGPLGRARSARLGWLAPSVAVVETAEAAGLRLLPAGRREPLRATSRGVGELIRAALDGGARRVIVGVGGSATTDGGAGLLTALGARVLDHAGRDLSQGGGALGGTAALDLTGLDPRLRNCRLDVAVDVFSPLLGRDGAAAVFAPQKGADAAQVRQLDRALGVFAGVAERTAGLPGLAMRPGAGAAGGIGFALSLLGATLVGGAALVCDEAGIDIALSGAALVITGEGRLDAQTAWGKAPAEVLARSRAHDVPCVAVCGVLGEGGSALFGDVIALSDLDPHPRTRVRSLLRRAARLAVIRSAGAAKPQR